MGKSYQVNTDFRELTKEMHSARMTGVLVYLAGISPRVRGLQRQTKRILLDITPQNSLCLPSLKLPSNLWFPTWLAQDAGNR